MNYPLISEYVETIKAAEDNFDQLKNLRPVMDDDGQPVMTSGGFAVVFKMIDEKKGKFHAVKCFLKDQEGRAEAYRQIAEELEYVSSTFLTPFKYLEKELFVDTNNSDESEFPVLLMDWVEGQTLDKYIREHIDDQYELSLLAYQFSRLAMWLLPLPFAHGDLKPDNILVKEDDTLVLVDYDGMYVPAMKGQKARELGSPDFRHPGRTEDVFDEHIDDFSLVSILLSLKAIALQPNLLEQYGASDRLLFSEKDYRNLSESQVMDALKTMMQDTELATLYSLFILSSAQNNLSQASFRLLNLSRPERTQLDGPLCGLSQEGFVYTRIKQCASKLMLCLEDEQKEELDKKLMLTELTILSVASVWDINNKEIENWHDYVAQRILNDYLSITEVNDYDVWIVNNTPGMYSDEAYTTEIAVSLSEFEKENGQITFFKGKINAYPYDDSFWGEFEDKSGEKQIIYVDQGFPFEYNVSDILKNKEGFGIVEEKETYYGGDEIVYCLKKIKKRHSMLPDYISERLSFYRETIEEAMSNCQKIKEYSFQLYNAVTNEILNFNNPYLGIDDLKIDDKTVVNCITGESYQYNATSLNNFTLGIDEVLNKLRNELAKNNPEDNLSTEVTEEDLKNAWTDEYGVKYSADKTHLIKAPSDIVKYSIREGTKYINNRAFDFCVKLVSITIPESVICIGDSSFGECHNLSEIKNLGRIETVGHFSFAGCRSLKSIKFNEGLVKMGGSVFKGCVSLHSVYIPSSVDSFGDLFPSNGIWLHANRVTTFDYCDSLKDIIIPVGSRRKFEKLLPNYKDKLVDENRGWRIKETRPFSPDEIAAVARAEVVPSQYGNSVCFFMNGGGQTYIPLLGTSSLTVGDSVDLKTAKLVTLCREGYDDIYRVIE